LFFRLITPFGTIAKQVEAVAQPFKYAGKFGVMAEPNGTYYMRARYYDPSVGRFISEDPSGFGGGDVNLMAYVGNNPVMGVDPTGLDVDWNKFFTYTEAVTGPFKSTLQKGIEATDRLVENAALHKIGIPTSVAQGVIGNTLGLGFGLVIQELTHPSEIGDSTLTGNGYAINYLKQDGYNCQK